MAEQVVIQSKDKINVVTPNGDKGPVDVVLDFDNGERFKIPGGFRYVEPKQNDDLRKAFFNKNKSSEIATDGPLERAAGPSVAGCQKAPPARRERGGTCRSMTPGQSGTRGRRAE